MELLIGGVICFILCMLFGVLLVIGAGILVIVVKLSIKILLMPISIKEQKEVYSKKLFNSYDKLNKGIANSIFEKLSMEN